MRCRVRVLLLTTHIKPMVHASDDGSRPVAATQSGEGVSTWYCHANDEQDLPRIPCRLIA